MDQDSKNIAVASYILPIGWIIAYVARYICNCRTSFATFHLRQSLGLNVIIFLFRAVFDILNFYIVSQLFSLAMLVIIAYFALNAYNGNKLLIPLVGKMFDNLFTFIK